LTGPAHPAGEITVKINYPEHHTINSTDSSYGLGKPENRVAVPVGAEIFLLTTAFSPVHPACCPMVQVSAIKRQGVIRITLFPLAPKLKKCISHACKWSNVELNKHDGKFYLYFKCTTKGPIIVIDLSYPLVLISSTEVQANNLNINLITNSSDCLCNRNFK